MDNSNVHAPSSTSAPRPRLPQASDKGRQVEGRQLLDFSRSAAAVAEYAGLSAVTVEPELEYDHYHAAMADRYLARNSGPQALGLSPVHKSPQAIIPTSKSVSDNISAAASGRSTPFAHKTKVNQPHVLIPDGGGYFQLKGGSVAPDVRRPAGATRGKCGSFNKRVRRRLEMKVKSINRKRVHCNPKMLTLTYPASWSPSPEDWKRDLAKFEKRLGRKYKYAAAIWVLEFQDRGAPHFHLLVYNVPFVCREWLARAWYEVVGSNDPDHLAAGTKVENIRNWDRASGYIGKYASKNEQKATGGLVPEHVGRWWGVFNAAGLPVDIAKEYVSFHDFYKARRLLGRYLNASMRQTAILAGRKPKRRRFCGSLFSGLTAYMHYETAHKFLSYLGYSEGSI